MNFNDYQRLAQRTSNTDTFSAKITNGILGLNGEAGECADLLKKFAFQGHDWDSSKLVKEMGDVLWYLAEIATGLGIDLDDVALMNIHKLRVRYPDGFDPERSKHRKGDGE